MTEPMKPSVTQADEQRAASFWNEWQDNDNAWRGLSLEQQEHLTALLARHREALTLSTNSKEDGVSAE